MTATEKTLVAEDEPYLQAAFDALPSQLAILDEAGTILAVNAAWRAFAEANDLGWADYGVGRNYLHVCESASGYSAEGAREVADGIRQLIACQRQEFRFEYPCHSPALRRWFVMHATRFHGGNTVCVMISHEDITDRKRAEETLRDRTSALDERVKELDCLYQMSDLVGKPGISVEEIVQQTLALIPPAWQYPEITAGRVLLEGREWRTENFARTPWRQAHDIMIQGKPVGSLEVYYLEERPLCDEGSFLREERHLLRAIAEQLGRSIEHVWTEDALAWEASIHAAMAELSRALIRSMSLEDIAWLILENAKALTGSRFGYVGYIDPETGYVLAPTLARDIWDICEVPEKDAVFTEFRGLWGWVLEHRSPLLTNEPANDPRASGTPQGHIPIERFLSVPALVGDELLGQVSLANPQRNYTEQDLALVEYLASLYALAVQQKRSEKALAETTRLLETILEHTHVLVAYMDSQFNFLRVNRAYAAADGQKPSFFPGRNHFDLYPSEENEAIFRQVVETGQPYSVYAKAFEYPDHPERGVSYWDWGLVPLKDSEGTVTGLVLTLANVTDRVQAERAVQETEELLRVIAANYPAYLSIIEKHGEDLTVEFTSGKEFGRLGLDPDDFAGLPLGEVFGEQTPIVRGHCLKAFRGEEVSFDLYINHQVQRYNVIPLPDESDEVPRILVVVEDITERRRAEEALRQSRDELELRVQERTAELTQANELLLAEIAERKRVEGALRSSEERFRQLAENVDKVFWMFEPDSNQLLYVSPHYETVWGRTCQSLYERPDAFLDAVHPEDWERVAAAFRRVREGHEDEFRIIRPDGSLCWVHTRAFPIYNQAGKVYRVAGIAKDITDERQSQAALIQAERLAIAGKLAASLAHEVNNPVQSAIGCLDLAQEALAEGEDPQAFLQVASEALQRTIRVVADLRDLSRQSQLEAREVVDPCILLDRVLMLTKAQCSKHTIEVNCAAEEGLPEIQLVPDAMQQVFVNLVLNAIDAMPEGGKLCVSILCSDAPPAVSIRFTDNGVGIPPEVIGHVFNPFYTTKTEGLGMGLFISQSIVQQHGGQIDVHSQVGVGTTFTVWLPA